MPNLGVMFKTVSHCNLGCTYCYSQDGDEPRAARTLSLDALERFLAGYMKYIDRTAVIGWQGGEPLAAGLKFFEAVVGLEKKHARPGTVIMNALQTNGTLIDDRWARFFQEYNFLIGVSLDGPQEIHDLHRKDLAGQGSFKRVMRGINILRKHQVPFNILCVMTKESVTRGQEIVRFFRESGFSHVQFIPRMDFTAFDPYTPAKYDLTPEEYGRFLCEAFDEWYQGGAPSFSIQPFDSFFLAYLNQEPDSCNFKGECPPNIVVDTDGSVYACDFYIHPGYCLGNVGEGDLADITSNPAFLEWGYPLRSRYGRMYV